MSTSEGSTRASSTDALTVTAGAGNPSASDRVLPDCLRETAAASWRSGDAAIAGTSPRPTQPVAPARHTRITPSPNDQRKAGDAQRDAGDVGQREPLSEKKESCGNQK